MTPNRGNRNRWLVRAGVLIPFLAGLLVAAGVGRMGEARVDANRVYELRVYHPVPGKLPALEARFRERTSKILTRHDLKVLGYWVSEGDSPSGGEFIWLLAHSSREEAKKNWEAMRADAEFQELIKAEQTEKLVEKVETTWLRPTDFSPMK